MVVLLVCKEDSNMVWAIVGKYKQGGQLGHWMLSPGHHDRWPAFGRPNLWNFSLSVVTIVSILCKVSIVRIVSIYRYRKSP